MPRPSKRKLAVNTVRKNVSTCKKLKKGDSTKCKEEKEEIAKTTAVATTDQIEAVSYNYSPKTTDGRHYTLKISCWNVAGMNSFMKNTHFMLEDEKPDILFVQETKLRQNNVDKIKQIAGYMSHFCSTNDKSGKKGYAGVALYTKLKPLNVTFGLGIEEHDMEGRVITAEFDKFYVVGVYVPNSGRGLVRLEYRKKWNSDFLAFLKQLDSRKPVICCGDMNVAHHEMDLANPKTNRKNAGFTDEERTDFTKLLQSGFIDIYRSIYPQKTGAYTFWTHMANCRQRNIGWRLDYFLLSERLKQDVCDVVIRSSVIGSDHCPITLFICL